MAPTIPRWQSLIEQGLSKYKNQNVVQIATLEQTISGDVTPRVRSHVIRGFLPNPANPGLPLILSTTDTRTSKVDQLLADARAELVWWLEGPNHQFRITGRAYVVPAPEAHPEVHARFLQALAQAQEDSALYGFVEFEWERTRVETFRALGRGMRASWARPTPPPGSVLEGSGEDWPKKLEEPDPEKEGYEETKRLWELALSRFSLVVIEAEEVDFVDLSTDPDTRTLFAKKEALFGVWEETALVP